MTQILKCHDIHIHGDKDLVSMKITLEVRTATRNHGTHRQQDRNDSIWLKACI